MLATPLWVEMVRLIALTRALVLFLMPLMFLLLGVYLGFVKLSQLSGGGSVRLGLLAGDCVYSLVPIAIAYQYAFFGDPKRALRSQFPVRALIILYTISSLWILS